MATHLSADSRHSEQGTRRTRRDVLAASGGAVAALTGAGAFPAPGIALGAEVLAGSASPTHTATIAEVVCDLGVDLPAVWQQLQDAVAEYTAGPELDDPDESPAWRRLMAAEDAIARARPADLADIAAQVAWLAYSLGIGSRGDEPEIPSHIARVLGRQPGGPPA
jgi:hypothetical protein